MISSLNYKLHFTYKPFDFHSTQIYLPGDLKLEGEQNPNEAFKTNYSIFYLKNLLTLSSVAIAQQYLAKKRAAILNAVC